MANASKHHMNHDGQGKGAGVGAMTDVAADAIGDNAVLSNRDKAQHSDTRGLDSQAVAEQQGHDTAANRKI